MLKTTDVGLVCGISHSIDHRLAQPDQQQANQQGGRKEGSDGQKGG